MRRREFILALGGAAAIFGSLAAGRARAANPKKFAVLES